MNIWIFNHYAVGPGSSGGTRHFDLSRKLVQRGHKVTIFASSFNHQTLKEGQSYTGGQLFVKKNYDGVRFIWIKTTPYRGNDKNRVLNMLAYSKRAFQAACSLKERPDFVIGSLVHPLAAYVGYLVAKKKEAVFYFEERDLWPQTLIDLGKINEKNPVIYALAYIEKFLYRKSKRTIVLFDKAVNYVTGKGVEREKVLYIPNGIDLMRTENSTGLPESAERILHKLKGKKIAVYTGTHGLANNLDAILDAAKTLQDKDRNAHFLLVGNGPEKPRLIERTNNESILNIDFLDPIPKESVPTLLSHCHIGLLPLQNSPVFKWGISPNKLFDYMGSSLPAVLLCDLDGTPVEKANGGFVIKNNFSTELADILMNHSKETLSELGKNARKYVEKEHNWDKLSEMLEMAMYKDINEKAAEEMKVS